MQLKKILTDKNFHLLLYKLAHDALFLLLVVLVGLSVAEGVLPGFITGHISFLKLIIAIFALMAAIAVLGSRLGIAYASTRMQKNKLAAPFLVFSFLLIGNTMLNLPFWQNLLVTLFMLLVFFLFYQLIFFPKKEDE